MLMGYNQPRPERKHYVKFNKKIIKGLNNLNSPGLGLMLYGSFVRGDYIPGKSDIDAVLVFPALDVITDKCLFEKCSEVVADSLIDTNILFQVTPCDIGTLKDGRFNSYTSNFYECFMVMDEWRVVVGPDYKHIMTFEDKKDGVTSALSHNLRKVRKGLLLSKYYIETDYENFLRNFSKSINACSQATKQILFLFDGRLRINRISALQEIRKKFSFININPIERIEYFYNHLSELDKLMKDKKTEELLNLWKEALTVFESLINEFIKTNPTGC